MGAGCASSSSSCPPASSTALTDQLRPSRHGLSSRAGWLQEIISNPTYYDCEPRNVLDLRHLAEWCWPTLADDSTRPTHNSGFMTLLAKDFLGLRYAVPSTDDEGYQMRQLQGAKLDGASPSSSPLSRSRSRSTPELNPDLYGVILTLLSPSHARSRHQPSLVRPLRRIRDPPQGARARRFQGLARPDPRPGFHARAARRAARRRGARAGEVEHGRLAAAEREGRQDRVNEER